MSDPHVLLYVRAPLASPCCIITTLKPLWFLCSSVPFPSLPSPLPHRSTLPALICVRRGCLVGLVVTRGGRHRVSLFCQRASPSLKLLQWRLARRRPRWSRLSHRLNLQPLRLPHQRCLAKSSRKLLPRSIETNHALQALLATLEISIEVGQFNFISTSFSVLMEPLILLVDGMQNKWTIYYFDVSKFRRIPSGSGNFYTYMTNSLPSIQPIWFFLVPLL